MKKAIAFSIILIGFTAMASQIILMREFLAVFYGNELSIGFILASWLIGGAVGSGVLGRLSDKIKFKITVFSLCLAILSVLLPLNILAIRLIKVVLNMTAGEIMPLFPMAISSLVILAPTCIILGFLFSLACRIYESPSGIGAERIGKVYFLEAVGSTPGGLIASFFLVRFLNLMQVMAIFTLLNAATAISLLLILEEAKFKLFFLNIYAIILAAAILLTFFNGWDRLNQYSLKSQWHGYELLALKNSIYGNIVVTKRDKQFSFFDNGLHLYTIPEKQSSEEAVHFALLEHPNPKDVLLVGGGVGGLVQEITKEPVKTIDYVELDPTIIEMAQEFLPDEYYEPLKDPRVSIRFVDGRFFIKGTNKKYDCVIINLGNPYTAQINRFYTLEFFKEVDRILKKGGIVSFAVTSSEDYINKELAEFLRSLYVTLSKAYKDVIVIPGSTAYFLATNEKGILTYDYKTLVKRVEERKLKLEYVREYYLFSRLSPERVAYIKNIVESPDKIRVNYDFRPISYYYDIIFWTTHFRDTVFSKMLKSASESRILKMVILVCGLIILLGIATFRYGREGFHRKTTLMAIMSTGFSSIALQIIILLSFQIIYGFLFYRLGFILTSFMTGLALGGVTIVKVMSRIKRPLKAFFWMQSALSAYPLLILLFIWILANSASALVSWVGANIIFLSLSLFAGFIGGFLFPLGNRIYLAKGGEVGAAAGLTYGIDLLGSCLGALLTPVFLIPVLGVAQTCLAVVGLNIALLAILFLNVSLEQRRAL